MWPGSAVEGLSMNDTLQDVLSFAANVIQVGSFIVLVILFLRTRQRLQRYIRAREQEVTARPWVLTISTPDDISGQVLPKLQSFDLPSDRVETYVHEGKLMPDDFYKVVHDLLKIKDKLTTAGVTEVHLFYKGPVSLAVAIGAVFDNWVPVKIYQFQDGEYLLYFVLEKGTLLGLLGSGSVSQIEDVIAVK
jgi:hypothetical protein